MSDQDAPSEPKREPTPAPTEQAPAPAEPKPTPSEPQPTPTEPKSAETEPKLEPSEPATPRKRRTSSPRASKDKLDEEETESEPEKPKKRAKTAKTPRKTPGRKKKALEPEDDEDEDVQQQVDDKVAALPDDVKSKFGQVAWAKMGGYPYWPCIITDPRLLPEYLQTTALNVMDTKHMVYFYVSNNYAPVLFKMIEPWEDTKFNYREGYPEKDSKAPKRRAKLMAAIELADKEVKLPVAERANGLLQPQKKEKKVEKPKAKPAAATTATPAKRRPGRPLGSKNKKTLEKEAAAAAAAAKKALKKQQAEGVATPEEDEEAAGPALSKDEIKAKVASRKAPKKKGAEDNASSAGAAAKKAYKAATKHGKSNGSSEIDSKRKKEIELVVPHKTVKSADIREMTEEAAKKKLSGPKSKSKKDKGDYKVGDLYSFASKMARLHAKESARNNDELVGMMQELFKEDLMYRSDVERSGLAAIIALLRKSMSPTVGQTASALRKHMIRILNNDTEIVSSSKKDKSGSHHDAAGNALKKRKVENGSAVKAKEDAQKPSSETKSSAVENKGDKENSGTKDKVSSPSTSGSEPKKESSEVKKPEDAAVKETEPKKETPSKPTQDEPVKTDDSAEKPAQDTDKKQPSSPIKVEASSADGSAENDDTVFEAAENIDKNREIFVDMLSKVLEHEGSKRADLAKEIEIAMYERFKESNDDYLTQARLIIFGLKENTKLRERLFSGNLHTLEVAYADDSFFKATE